MYRKYIAECLNSIVSQSYENLEIIIIDDGSTDNTKQKIQPFLLKMNKMFFIKKIKGYQKR